MSEDYAHIIETARRQEELLRFDHFSARDAWELGSFLVRRVFDRKIDMAISIRKLNGSVVFQYTTENTSLSNQKWMQRKFNTVCLTEGSSLRAWATAALKGQSLADQGIRSEDYAFCGGGFPIRLTSGEFIGAAIVSNLPHREDHRFIAGALAAYLHREDVPFI